MRWSSSAQTFQLQGPFPILPYHVLQPDMAPASSGTFQSTLGQAGLWGESPLNSLLLGGVRPEKQLPVEVDEVRRMVAHHTSVSQAMFGRSLKDAASSSTSQFLSGR